MQFYKLINALEIISVGEPENGSKQIIFREKISANLQVNPGDFAVISGDTLSIENKDAFLARTFVAQIAPPILPGIDPEPINNTNLDTVHKDLSVDGTFIGPAEMPSR